MFRPTVVQTPVFITIIILAWRVLRGLARAIYRHPIVVLVSVSVLTIVVRYGWEWVAGSLATIAVALSVWALVDRVSFARWVGWRLLAYWRLVRIYRPHWQFAMSGAGLSRMARGLEYRPGLVRVVCTPVADQVTVKMLKGQSVADWSGRTDHLAHAFGSRHCRVSVVRAGVLRLTFSRRDPLAKPIAALPIPERVLLHAVPVGLREDGKPWMLKLHGTHVLVAGATGAGKGSILWSAVRGLLPAIRAGLVEVVALDPKLMELSYGRRIFRRYASTPEDCAKALEEVVTLMQDRAGLYAGHHRSHTPTIEYPFVLVLVDEVAFLTAYQNDKGLKERVKAALATLTTQGRSVGVGVLAALQDPAKRS